MIEFFANKKLYTLDAIMRVADIFKKENIGEIFLTEDSLYYLIKIKNISGESDALIKNEFGNFVIAEMKNRKS